MYKYHPQIKKVLDLVNNNEIGEIKKIVSSFGFDLLTKKYFWFFKKTLIVLLKIILRNSSLFKINCIISASLVGGISIEK